MSYDGENYIINYFEFKKKDNNYTQCFKPLINNRSRIFANNYDKKMKRYISSVVIKKYIIDK